MSTDYVITLSRVSKAYGKKVVLDNINLSFIRGARIGVIGPNGSGKSSLLKVLAGVDTEFEGSRHAADGLKIGYVPQEPQLTPGTVRQNLEEAVAPVRGLLTRYEQLNEKLGDNLSPDEMQKVLDEIERVQAQIEATNAWDLDRQLDQASHALGLPAMDADVGRCSGGERRRTAICKVLLEHPDVLLLDEPTNHLDADAVDWLERHLAAYEGTVIAVTHDRYFLDNVAQWMLEMERGRGTPYHGNYSAFLQEKQARETIEAKLSYAQSKLLERELDWIRQSPKARTTKNKARVRKFEELYEKHLNREKNDDAITLVIPPGDKLGQKVIRVEGVSKSFGERKVLNNVTFELPPGAVLGVIGPNGAGKTTLLKIIAGSVKPDTGGVDLGPTVRTCFVDQDRADLDPDKSVWEEISDGLDELSLGPHEDQQPGLRLEVQLQEHRSAAEGGHALRRAAQPRADGQDAAPRRQPAAGGRAHQRPGRDHHPGARGRHRELPRLRDRGLPRPLLPGQGGHAHPRLPGRRLVPLLGGQLRDLQGAHGHRARGGRAGPRDARGASPPEVGAA